MVDCWWKGYFFSAFHQFHHKVSYHQTKQIHVTQLYLKSATSGALCLVLATFVQEVYIFFKSRVINQILICTAFYAPCLLFAVAQYTCTSTCPLNIVPHRPTEKMIEESDLTFLTFPIGPYLTCLVWTWSSHEYRCTGAFFCQHNINLLIYFVCHILMKQTPEKSKAHYKQKPAPLKEMLEQFTVLTQTNNSNQLKVYPTLSWTW